MAKHQPRAIVVGVDSISMKLVERFAAEGCLPHVSALMARGASLHALACLPAYTPTNWATLATGAWPGTHGAGNRNDAAVTDPPGRQPMSTFDSRAITAETIWEAAERQGLASLAIAYPGSSPSRLERGMVVAPLPRGLWSLDLVPGCQYCAGAERPDAIPVTLTDAGDWPQVGAESLEALLQVMETGARDAARVGAVEDGAVGAAREARDTQGVTMWLVLPGNRGSYERALLFDARGAAQPLAALREGEWSPWIVREFPTDTGPRPAAMRFKLLELTPDGKRLRVLRSAVSPTTGFTEPAELSAELVQAVGPYFEHAAVAHAWDLGAYEESVFDEMEYQVAWHAKAAAHLLETRGWDLFYNHWHFPDMVQHHFMSQADPDSPCYDPLHAEAYVAVLRQAYELGDHLLGGLMELAGPRTYVALVSDHGNTSTRYACHLERRLQEVGLLHRTGSADDDPIDWAHTLAYPHGGGFQINVNLAGREPHGVVDPRDHERVQERIIDALYDWRNEEGRRAVAFALKKKDAALVGYWGERTGDVVFIYNAGFAWHPVPPQGSLAPARGAYHGPQVPTAETALSSNLATWIIAGPRIKHGYRRDMNHLGPARLLDFVPTLCHALSIAPPAQCQGAVEYDIFKD